MYYIYNLCFVLKYDCVVFNSIWVFIFCLFNKYEFEVIVK